MAMHVCVSQGVASKRTFDPSGSQTSLTANKILASRIDLRGIADAAVMRRLRDWSIHQHALELREHPLQGLPLIPVAGDDAIVQADPQFADLTTSTPFPAAPPVESQWQPLPPAQTSPPLPDPAPGREKHPTVTSFNRVADFPASASPATVSDDRGPLYAGNYQPPQQQGQPAQAEPHAWWELRHEATPGSQTADANRLEEPRHAAPSLAFRESPPDTVAAIKPDIDRLLSAANVSSSVSQVVHSPDQAPAVEAPDAAPPAITHPSPTVSHPIARRIAPRMLPAGKAAALIGLPGPDAAAPPSSSNSDEPGRSVSPEAVNERNREAPVTIASAEPPTKPIDPDLMERRRKAQIRRERNRAAARRSNLKQKAVRDGLRVELQAVVERVEVLRVRELALRKENLELRRALSALGR